MRSVLKVIVGSELPTDAGAERDQRIQHVGQVLSMAYVPMVMLLLGRALDRRSAAWGVAAGIVAGFMVLGRDQAG